MMWRYGLLLLGLACAAPKADFPPASVSPSSANPNAAPSPSFQQLKAQYDWGYVGDDGQGQGTLSLLLEPDSKRLVLELYGLGERIAFLSGNAATGYHLQIPRQEVDITRPTLEGLPLPFFPQLGGVDALQRLLQEGQFPGVNVTKRDAQGPVKMRYTGHDERGRECMVWLTRTRWEKH